MDSRELLSHIHVLSLLIACVSGTALITLFFLDVVWFHNVRHSLDEQLRKTAEIIKVAFENKLEKTVNLLRAYDDSDDFEKDFAYVTEGEYFHSSDLSYHHFCAAEANLKCGGYSKEDRWVARKEYPYLCNENNKKAFPHHCDYDSVFWVDPDKNVRITWITKPEFYLQTSNVSLAHREYVNRIQDPDPKSSLWHTTSGHPFYAQPLHALGSGKHQVVLSMASSHREQEDSQTRSSPKWVAAIETEFQFLKSVAIPDGTGFDVIEDDSGKVLLHSDENESLWENFFEETDNKPTTQGPCFLTDSRNVSRNILG